MSKKTNPLFSLFSAVTVSAYLIAVGAYLILSGKIKPSVSLGKLIKMKLKPKLKGPMEKISAEDGHCFIAHLPPGMVSDKEGISRLVVFENGKPLQRGHVGHEEIRRQGGGLYSHWGETVYFSASDNSNPAQNGRVYTFAEV